MILLSDLKRFNVLLESKNTETIKKLCILKKLETWDPVKDFIVVSNIGKTVFRISKLGGDVGLKASIIVRKWKKYLLPSPQKKIMQPVIIDKVNLVKEKKQIPKKNSLSLNDYYKRKGIEIKENAHDELDSNKLDPSTTNREELTSDLGISFMDSFSIRPSIQLKPKKSKLPKISEIRAIVDHGNILRRNDIINQSNTIQQFEDENLTLRVEGNLKYWQPKAPTYCFTGKQPQTLLKMCQDVLLINRVHIEEVYWTPRELLLTVLENYTPDQLFNFESFNPHFVVDNDELWHKHFLSKYPDHTERRSKESWRNVFLRTVSEISEKFESSVRNMKRKIEDNKRNDEKHQVKILNSSHRNPEKRRFFLGQHGTESMYSSVTQKLMKQCRRDCSYFKF